MNTQQINRRKMLTVSGLSLAAGMAGTSARAAFKPGTHGFDYEVVRTEAEWKAQLSPADYKILREGATEVPKSSPLWDETRAGGYSCKGCDLPLYESRWKVVLDKGWAFFNHADTNSLLMGIDWPEGADRTGPHDVLAMVEVHCRRCGSHMGHIVSIDNKVLHCINGASLTFTPSTV